MKKSLYFSRRRFLGQTTAAGGLLIMDGLFSGAQAANDDLGLLDVDEWDRKEKGMIMNLTLIVKVDR